MVEEATMEVFGTLDTHPYRLAMKAYAHEWGLADEKGFETAPHGPLQGPGHRFLNRIQTNMHARHILAEHYIDGVLNAPTRKILIPPITFGEAVAHTALSQVGVHEVPWGSNTGPEIRVYQSATGAYYSPWCASFVSWALKENGYTGRVSARAYDWADIGTKVSLAAAKVGDIVPFNIGDGHVGIFLSQSRGMVKTVDGNTSDQVAIRERPTSVIRAITRHGR